MKKAKSCWQRSAATDHSNNDRDRFKKHVGFMTKRCCLKYVLFVLLLAIRATPALAQVDFSGEWFSIPYEDPMDRRGGPEIGDYTGLPINDANRMRGDTHDPSSFALPEWQCRPHGVDWITFGLSDLRIDKVIDPTTGRLTAWHLHWLRSAYDRYIWMDGRPHPSEY